MKDLNVNLLRHHQREEMKDDIQNYDTMIPHAKPEERGMLMQRRDKAKRSLDTQSPEPLTGAEKDKLYKLEKRLKDKILNNMPTDEVMRKNPAGAVDWHQRWEKANKKLVRIWKNVRIQLNPDSQDRDLANIDRYRPSGQTDRMRTDAQIPGLISYGNVDEEQWPFEQPTNTALAQAQKHYDETTAEEDVNRALADMEAQDHKDPVAISHGFGPSGKLSLEEFTALEARLKKAREVLAKKREDARNVDAVLESVPVEPDASFAES